MTIRNARFLAPALTLLCALASVEAVAAGQTAPSSFIAQEVNGAVAVQWTTASDAGIVGFFLKRWDPRSSRFVDVNSRIVPALIESTQGGTYRYLDTEAPTGRPLQYLLVEIEASGKLITQGPFSVDTRGTASGSELSGDSELSHRGQSRKAHPKWNVANRARAEAEDRDRKRIAKHSKVRKEQNAKIGVKETGLYYVSLEDLSEQGGLSLARTAKNAFGLTNQGREVSLLTSNDGAGIYFYGVAPESNLQRDSVYRISNRGSNQMRSRRNPARTPRPTGAEVFTRTVHVEEDRIEATNASTDPDGDFWVWDYAFAGIQAVSIPFRTDGATGTGSASITVRLRGGVESPGGPDHRARISLNSAILGDISFDGLQAAEATIQFDSSLLTDGPNLVNIEGLTDTGAWYSLFYVDSFDVSYESRYRATGNRGEFKAASNRSVFITGFTQPEISVFDVTDPNDPVLVATPPSLHTDGTYGVVVASADAAAVYYAVTPDATMSPARVLPDAPSSLRARSNRAEYLVITTEALLDAAQTLADYRADLRSQVIDIEDIYDEFNFGNASPYALRDFLAYTRTQWRDTPRYVVLAGDGNYDYKDVQAFGNNLIPVRMADTPSGLYQDDSWFVAPDGASVEEIALGRLPVTTSEELTDLIRKIVAREAALGQAWTGTALLLADNPDEAGNFVTSQEGVAAALPLGTPIVRAYFTTDGVFGSRAKLINGINSGTGFVSYFGHGGFDQLAGESVFTSSHAPLLNNAQRPAVMTAMTCLVGNSSLPGRSSVGEILVRRAGGGLVALWGPSGWSENHLAEPLAQEFYRAAFDPGTARIGDAVNASRKVYRDSQWPAWMLSIYNLLGDPALKLR